MGTLAVTALAVGFLAFAPTGDGSYSGVDVPIVRVFSPEQEMNDSGFFNSGAQCNADANTRSELVALALAVGAAAACGAVVSGRRRRAAGRSRAQRRIFRWPDCLPTVPQIKGAYQCFVWRKQCEAARRGFRTHGYSPESAVTPSEAAVTASSWENARAIISASSRARPRS